MLEIVGFLSLVAAGAFGARWAWFKLVHIGLASELRVMEDRMYELPYDDRQRLNSILSDLKVASRIDNLNGLGLAAADRAYMKAAIQQIHLAINLHRLFPCTA